MAKSEIDDKKCLITWPDGVKRIRSFHKSFLRCRRCDQQGDFLYAGPVIKDVVLEAAHCGWQVPDLPRGFRDQEYVCRKCLYKEGMTDKPTIDDELEDIAHD